MTILNQFAQITASTDEEAALEGEFTHEAYYPDENEDVLYSLLEEILSEVFVIEEDKDSLDYLIGNSIYDLSSESQILYKEKKLQEALDEGCPDVEDFEELLLIAEEYFKSPESYPLTEDEYTPAQITGFIQINCGYKTDKDGNISEYWKSTSHKIQIESCLLMEPNKIISLIEKQGIIFNEFTRIVFYGTPLVQFIDSKIYSPDESKETTQLSKDYPNILLAVPSYEDTVDEFDSIYDWANHIIQEEVAFSGVANIGKVFSHWEMTKSRIESIAEERNEEKLLNLISLSERRKIKGQNNFWDKFKSAKATINGLNSGCLTIKVIGTSSLDELERILLLCDKYDFKINTPTIYLQIKSIVTNSKLKNQFTENQFAISIINKVNKGELVEFHLLSHELMEQIFSILWGNLGIRIIPERKEIYHLLKARLFQLRKAKLRKLA